MEIILNNQPKTIETQTDFTVQQLLDLEIPQKQKGIAVAINNKVIPKTEWAEKKIFPNDQLLIIKATQGG
ncbi:MAG TPA: sulfur carrier protein ThiS [Bacteroidia bacterium]|nr:sulfur carrier protein ThiS [Bacteroidia bacterium]